MSINQYYGLLRNLPVKDVKINDSFWSKRLEVIRKKTIYDVLEKFSKDGTPENPATISIFKSFMKVAKGEKEKDVNFPWFDGLIYETIKGISDFLANEYDDKIDKKLDEYIELINMVQAADPQGYINTYTTLSALKTDGVKMVETCCGSMNFTMLGAFLRQEYIITVLLGR
jgi:DUF1680 family protein